MKDLINRQEAIDALIELSVQRDEWDNTEGFAQKRGIDAAICAIEDLPSTEQHGKWEDIEHAPDGLMYVTCSVCGKRQTVEFTSYCGNCGAKMERAENE